MHGIGMPQKQSYPCLIAAQHGLEIRGRTLAQEMTQAAMWINFNFLLIAVEMSAVHFVYYIWRVLHRIMLIPLQLQGKEYVWQLKKRT